MTIKSDLWIRRAATEQSLITPFEPTLVRNVDGRRIISAGCSSYGYDMRLADDGFRVFSPVHGREIDPKKFDEESLVEPPVRTTEDGSRYYLMPPHSYALGVSVETFQMPRNVTGVCLGKCLTRDAQIVDAATGDHISIADFTADGQTLAYTQGRISARNAFAAISQGIKPTFILKTRLGYKITATSNHPFLTVSGWRELSELSVGSRIAAARRINIFGKHELPEWEATLLGLMVSEGQCHTPGSSPMFTSTDEAMVSAAEVCVRSGLGGDLTYNGNCGYRLVNRKGRGGIAEKNKATRWLASYGLNVGALEKFVPSCVFRATKNGVALFLRALFSGAGSIYVNHPRGRSQSYAGLDYCSSSERLARDVQHLLLRFGIVSRLREKRTTHAPTFILEVFRRDDIKTFLDEIGFLPGSAKDVKAREIIRPLLDSQVKGRRRLFDTLPSEFWSVMKVEAQALNTSLYASGIHVHNAKDVPYLDLARFIAHRPQTTLACQLDADVIWDEVVSIETGGNEEVFDICVPDVHNFIANNLIVHNSTYARAGLLVNTTPLEAGWRGRLVIELGNLANLPIRVYVNEGIGQVLFFESDEDCSVSYDDRGGKYQGQTGLTYSRL